MNSRDDDEWQTLYYDVTRSYFDFFYKKVKSKLKRSYFFIKHQHLVTVHCTSQFYALCRNFQKRHATEVLDGRCMAFKIKYKIRLKT